MPSNKDKVMFKNDKNDNLYLSLPLYYPENNGIISFAFLYFWRFLLKEGNNMNISSSCQKKLKPQPHTHHEVFPFRSCVECRLYDPCLPYTSVGKSLVCGEKIVGLATIVAESRV